MLYPHKGYRGFESLSLRIKKSLAIAEAFLFEEAILEGILTECEGHTYLNLIYLVTSGLSKIATLVTLAVVFNTCQVNNEQNIAQTIPEQYYQDAIVIGRVDGLEAAERFADSLYRRMQSPSPIDYWRKRTFDAYLHEQRGQFDRALEIMDSLIAFIEDPGRYTIMQNQLAITYLLKGDTYNNYLFKNDLAYTNYVRARIIGLNLEDKCLIAAYDARFAVVLYRRQNYLDAVNYFKKALQNYDGCDDEVAHFTREQRWNDDIAISFAKAGRFDSALIYHEKALNYIQENRFLASVDSSLVDIAIGVILGNKGQTLVALGRPDEAEPMFRKSIDNNSPPGFDNNDANLTRLHLANLLMSRGRLNEVESLIEKVESYTKIDTNPTTMARLLDTRSRYRQMKGDYQQALSDRLLQNQLQDSISRANMLVFVADASSEYNYILAQQELERLRAVNQIRTLWLFAGSVVVLLFTVVLILIYYAWRQSKISMTLLQDLNNQINQQKIKLESTVQQLKEASTEKDRIMWMVAHDLRNPLGAIDNLAKFLDADYPVLENHEIVNQISFAAKSAIKFIGDILTIADQDSINLDARNTDINQLIYRTVEMMQFRAKEKSQRLVFNGLGDVKMMLIDPEKITRAVFNLIGNAVKFSPQEAVIHVNLTSTDGKIVISVIDQGIGVPAEMRKDIFESFTKAKRSGTSGEKPYGLGLSIALNITNAHGGQLTLSDNPSGGSIFTIELPEA